MIVRCWWRGFLASLALVPIAIESQRPGCSACSIAIERHLSLRVPATGPQLYLYNLIVVRPNDRYYVAPTKDLAGVLVFSSDGSFAHRIGERGEGPGKFRNIESLALGPGDSVYVFDVRDLHLTVLSPAGTIVRRVSVPGRVRNVAHLGRGVLVAHMPLNTPSEYGLPLHLLNPNGQLVRSFGAAIDQQVAIGRDHVLYRVVARATDSTVWSSRVDSVALEEWSVTGRLLRRIEGELARRANDIGVTEYSKQDPGPRLRHIQQSSDGFVWVIMTFPSGAATSNSVGEQRQELRAQGGESPPRALKTLIVAVDARSGRVLASRVHDDVIEGISSDGYAYGRTAPDGAIQLWRLRLR